MDTTAPENLIEVAARKLGTQQKLAEAMGVSPQAIVKWKHGRIPAERVLELERVSGIARHVLRPDLYPPSEAAA